MDSLRSYPSLASLSEAAATELEQLARNAIAERGRFTIALSGGNTPRSLYKELAKRSLDWSRIHLFWGDERYVPQDDPDSNYQMAEESLIDHIGIPNENVHAALTTFSNPEEAARQYESEIKSFFGKEIPQFDLILLGLGEDGHIASLFPNANAYRAGLVVVTHSPKPPNVRISLSFKVINNARDVFFLVAGKEKSEILHEVLEHRSEGVEKYPADFIHARGKVIWFFCE